MMTRRNLALLAVAILLGCSNSANNDPLNSTSEPVDPRPIVKQIATAQCEKILECCAGEELERVLGPGVQDQAACETAILNQAQAFFLPALERALEAETITLADFEVDGCVEALEARQCGEFEPVASANVLAEMGCGDVVDAKLALSGFCADDFECETGFCSRPPAESEGSCKNPPQIGEPCLNDRCDSFLACSPTGTCVEKLGDGEVCTRNADCRSDVCSPGNEGELVCVNVTEICAE